MVCKHFFLGSTKFFTVRILTRYIDLANIEDISRENRLNKSFDATKVSIKLCMFHVCFLRLFRYSARTGEVINVNDTKRRLDSLWGRPTITMKNSLQKYVKRIKVCNTNKYQNCLFVCRK